MLLHYAHQNVTSKIHEKWKCLIKATNDDDLEQKITLFLAKMHQFAPKNFQAPLHMFAKYGDLILLKHLGFCEKCINSFFKCLIFEYFQFTYRSVPFFDI